MLHINEIPSMQTCVKMLFCHVLRFLDKIVIARVPVVKKDYFYKTSSKNFDQKLQQMTSWCQGTFTNVLRGLKIRYKPKDI